MAQQRRLKSASVKHGVTGASVVAPAVPATSGSPATPGLVIIRRGIGISRFNRCTIGALGLLYRLGYDVPSHRGSYEYGRNDSGRANQSEIRHAYFLFLVTRMTKRWCEQRFRPRFLKGISLSLACLKSKVLRVCVANSPMVSEPDKQFFSSAHTQRRL
jgi:hypothetical protein